VGSRAILDVLENIKIGAYVGSQNMILGVKLLIIRINYYRINIYII